MWRHITINDSKISGSQQSFLTETTICIDEQWKKSMGYCLVPKCNHAQESHTRQFFRFFLPFLQDHGFLRSRYIAALATWRNDFFSLFKNAENRKQKIEVNHMVHARTRWVVNKKCPEYYYSKWINAVPDPDLEIGRGRGRGRSSRPLDKGGPGVPKKLPPPWIRQWNVGRKFREIVQIPCDRTSCIWSSEKC